MVKKALYVLFAIGVVASAAAAYDSAQAHGWGGGSGQGQNQEQALGAQADFDPAERHEAVFSALEAGDYEAWSEVMGQRGPARFVTEENFETFVAMHDAMMSGDYETASELRAELGLGQGRMGGRGMHRGAAAGPHEGCPMWQQ